MSEPSPALSITAPVPYLSPWQRWKKFWFQPADPTTLGFIRIMTGLLVLYIYLTYSLDLQAFFGRTGWYAWRFIETERHEAPYTIPPFNDKWGDTPQVNPQLSDYPHRRAALMQYLRSIPSDIDQRTRDLAYLSRITEFGNPAQTQAALEYVQRMGLSEERLDRYLKVLVGGTVFDDQKDGEKKNVDVTPSYAAATPKFFLDLPDDQKGRLASEIRAFWLSLSRVKWDNPTRDRDYIFNHFVEISQPSQKALLDYMKSLPSDTGERKKLLDYLEYWNTDPRKVDRIGASIFSIWFHVNDPTEMAFIHTGVLILILLFTLGLFTRVTSVLVWLATVSYVHRTQQVLFGMDVMMNILLFYLMIGNSGAALSIDRLIARYRAVRASLRRSGTIDANTRAFLACPPPSMSAGFAVRLIQIHFCFIYAAAGLSKLKGHMWWSGQAFWEVVVNPEFTLMQYPWYETTIHWLVHYKWMYHLITAVSVWFTLFVEIGAPFLLWTRLRWLMIFLATAMHAAIGVLMGLNLFELLMIVMLLAFLPDRVIRDRFRSRVVLPKLSLTLNAQNSVHARAAALALAGDVDNQISLSPSPNAANVSLTDANNIPSTGQDGVAALFKSVRFLSIVGFVLWIPGVRGLLTKLLFPSAITPVRDAKANAPAARAPAARG